MIYSMIACAVQAESALCLYCNRLLNLEDTQCSGFDGAMDGNSHIICLICGLGAFVMHCLRDKQTTRVEDKILLVRQLVC